MESKIAEALDLKYVPVAILWTDEKLEEAGQFKEGKWECVMWMLARAAKGENSGCWNKATIYENWV